MLGDMGNDLKLKSTAHERLLVGVGCLTIGRYLLRSFSNHREIISLRGGMNTNTFPFTPDYVAIGVLIVLMAWAATRLYRTGKL